MSNRISPNIVVPRRRSAFESIFFADESAPNRVNEEVFRGIVRNYILPMFSGAEIVDGSRTSTRAHQLSAYEDPCTIRLKPTRESPYRIAIRRRQPFSPQEKGVIDTMVECLGEILPTIGTANFTDLLTTFVRRGVARVVGGDTLGDSLLAILDQYDRWSTRLYEGRQITASIGLTPESGQGIHVNACWRQDYSAVITNGIDTMVICSGNGRVMGYEALDTIDSPRYAPNRFRAVANWATDGRVAVSLTRSGEILVFSDQRLRFARRGGTWHYFTHDQIVTQIRRPNDDAIRWAIYETCLDASFARTGACIAVVTSGNIGRISSLVDERDRIGKSQSTKSRMFGSVIRSPFHEIDRRIRQELVAVDGATIIDHEGKLLAIGAIVKVGAGSTGGGRLAAAKALSHLGLGIKVSQDGSIRGFHGSPGMPAELTFSVC